MNGTSRVALRWPVLLAGAIALVAIGAVATYWFVQPHPPTQAGVTVQGAVAAAGQAPVSNPPAVAPKTQDRLPDVIVTITPEAIERARIVVAPVTAGTGGTSVRLPAVVEPNAYKQVTVTPLVAGRITRVLVELGQSVRSGQAMAEIFSPELAEAETRYVSARAELDAHERELQRTEKLVDIGAETRQELERLHAEHTARLAGVESARSHLELLGLSAAAIRNLAPGQDATAVTIVPAPIAGVVTERAANTGLNVDTAAKLFAVVDLSTVWVVADLYEKDFSRVRVGTPVTVTTKAYPDAIARSRVSYIDPQVNAQTRTARMRIEVPNPRSELRLGMYADVSIQGAGQDAVPVIPLSAVQNVGDRTVVYVADPQQPGKFTEREIRLADTSGDQVAVLEGLHVGDAVVTQGSFSVRAERERLGLRPSAPSPQTGSGIPAITPQNSNIQTAKVMLTEHGYEPPTLSLRAGAPAQITFVRTTDKTCGTEVVFPTLNVRRALPLNQPVTIEFTPAKTGEIGFVCGMNMLRGRVVVE